MSNLKTGFYIKARSAHDNVEIGYFPTREAAEFYCCTQGWNTSLIAEDLPNNDKHDG